MHGFVRQPSGFLDCDSANFIHRHVGAYICRMQIHKRLYPETRHEKVTEIMRSVRKLMIIKSEK